ncbi:DUF4232 domain-containing protein [Amycolatopsis sp. NPDC059657]|uniref:DUF4232 domain-containing protein n=1 Tax=Amycolatopsis sp. NPDC059657 TaxID=3346899 RepID=UPI00366DDEC9
MNTRFKAVAGLAVATAGVVLLAPAASANPSDKPCDISDLTASVTPDSSSAAGQQAYVIHYVAAGAHTNCKLQGVPTAVTFTKGSGHSEGDGSGIVVVPDDPSGDSSVPVNIQPGKPAESRILMASQAPVTFVPSVVNLNLPITDGDTVTVGWPAGAPLKGKSVEVTAVSAA